MEPALVGAGLGADYAHELAAMYDAIDAGAASYDLGVGEDRQDAVTLRDALAALAANIDALLDVRPGVTQPGPGLASSDRNQIGTGPRGSHRGTDS